MLSLLTQATFAGGFGGQRRLYCVHPKKERRMVRKWCLAVAVTVAGCVMSGGVVFSQEHEGQQYTQADVEAGYVLYNANCITCHGPNGDSIPGINLRAG